MTPLDVDLTLSNIAFWAGRLIFAFVAGTFIIILVIEWLLVLRGRREKKFMTVWEPILSLSTVETVEKLPVLQSKNRVFFLVLWNHYQQSLKGEPKENLNKLVRHIGLNSKILRDLRSFSTHKKLLAIMTVGHLREERAWDYLIKLSHSRNIPLSLMAARALLLIDLDKGLPQFMNLLIERCDWSPALVGSVLKEAGADAISSPLAAAALNAPEKMVARLVEYFSIAHQEKVSFAIHQILSDSQDPETIAACLRVLSDPNDLETARYYLKHPAWFVRVQAANFIGRYGCQEDQNVLIPLLSDSEWWVRYKSSVALASLPKMTASRMREIYLDQTDRYARDMLDQAIAEKFEVVHV